MRLRDNVIKWFLSDVVQCTEAETLNVPRQQEEEEGIW